MGSYTQEQHDFIVSIAHGKKYREIADMFNEKYGTNKNVQAIATYCRKYKINNGITSELTQLKKGHNNNISQARALGSENLNNYGDILVKVKHHGKKEERWRLKKDVVWESYYGKKPKLHMIMHLNGNKHDCRIENLILCRVVEYVNLSKQGYISEEPALTLSALYYLRLRYLRQKRECELKIKS